MEKVKVGATPYTMADNKAKLRDAIQATVNAASSVFGESGMFPYAYEIEAAILKAATWKERTEYQHKRQEVRQVLRGIESDRYNR